MKCDSIPATKPQYHLSLGRNPIQFWMAVKIRPINWLEEFNLQFNSAVLAFLICFMNGIQAGCEPEVESGFSPLLPQLAFGGNSVLILVACSDQTWLILKFFTYIASISEKAANFILFSTFVCLLPIWGPGPIGKMLLTAILETLYYVLSSDPSVYFSNCKWRNV